MAANEGTAGQDPPPQPAQEDVAQGEGSSEQHIDTAIKIVPMVMIVMFLFFYDYFMATIIVFLIVSLALRGGLFVQSQARLRQDRSVVRLLGLALLLVLFLPFIVLSQRAWWYLVFVAPHQPPLPFIDCLLIAAVLDAVVKSANVSVKAVLVALGPYCVSFESLGKVLAMVEVVFQAYNAAVLVPVWTPYLFSDRFHIAFSSLLWGFYISWKIYHLLYLASNALQIARMMVNRGPAFGKYSTPEEIAESGEPSCPICREEYSTAITCECGHVFCQECISEWMQREPSCPLCRTNIKPKELKNMYTDGSTQIIFTVF